MLVTVFLLSGCSLFEPMVKLQAGKVVDRELDARKSDLEGAAEHNRVSSARGAKVKIT